jgi:FkbM family methyltransferase
MRQSLVRIRNRIVQSALPALLRSTGSADLARLGSDYGGWWVPRSVLRPGAVAYCAGAGEDITFDLALLERGLQVTTFDPTPRAIAHVAQTAPDIPAYRFEPIGWWDSKTDLRFYAPSNPLHVSHSAVNLQATEEYFTAAVDTVHAIAARLGDAKVDLIKMDIEGAEYRVLASLLELGPRPEVLCVEFDQPAPVRRTLKAARALREAGYDLLRLEGFNATFARRTSS